MHYKNQFDLIISLFSNGKAQEAIDELKPLIDNNPNDAVLFNIRGACNAQLGEPIIAIKDYEKAIEIDSNYSEAHNNLGITYHGLAEPEKALANFEKAFSLKPDKIEVIDVMMSILNEINDPNTSIEYYLKIIKSSPEIFIVHFNLGTAYQELDQTDEAIDSYTQAIKLNPEFADAYLNLGIIFENSGKLNDALQYLKKANEIEPDNLSASFNLGLILRDTGQTDEAIKSFERVIQLSPDNAESYSYLGELFFESRKHNRALTNFNMAFSINPDIDYLFGNLLYTKMQLCHWDNFEENVKILASKIKNNEKVISPFSLMAIEDDPQAQLKASQIYANSNFPKNSFSSLSKILKPYSDHKKIRIGYFSTDFHNHPGMHLMAELFENHDKSKFEIIAFSLGPDKQDKWRKRVVNSFDKFIDVRLKTDQEIVLLARKMEIDIAVNRGGYTQGCRPNIFANSCAPIQVNFLGFPGTTGDDYIDYIIADQTIIPSENKKYFSEKIVYMPDTYQVNMSKRDISNQPLSRHNLGLPEQGFIFCCFNGNHKITPACFGSWMRILKAVPGSVLWLYANNEDVISNILNTASRFGISENRIIFANNVPVEDHLNRISQADLFLDTLPYNAHTTSSDALRMGVPVLTLIGNSFASRVAASLLNSVNMPELITTSQDAYESLAIELALNSEKLDGIKKKLIGNLPTSALFNSRAFAKYLELAFESMHQKSQLEIRHEHIFVKDLLE